jgi:uncharacterized phage protein (TIGR02218 family)
MMRELNAALKAVLATGGPFVVADLYEFTFGADTVRWCGADHALSVGGKSYTLGPPIDREHTSWKLGLEVTSLDITITDDESTLLDGEHLVVGAWKNRFDQAHVVIRRFVSDAWDNTAVGATHMFEGKVGDVSVDGKQIKLTVESSLAELNATFPRTYFLPSCTNALYGPICGLLAANFTSAGSVGSNPSAGSFTLAGANKDDDYFAQGKVKFTSGPCKGQIRSVKSYKNGIITLAYPLYTVPEVGDTVDAIAGCDKTTATCKAKFDNIKNFRGFKYLPIPATQYTGAPSGNSGGDSGGGHRGGGGGRPVTGGRGHAPIRAR